MTDDTRPDSAYVRRVRLYPDATARIRAYQKRRLAAGARKISIFMNPDAVKSLAVLETYYGSKTAAIEESLKMTEQLLRSRSRL